MKGLNDMEFGIGDIVRVKPGCVPSKFIGVTGVVKEKKKCLWNSDVIHVVEVPKSVVDNQVILETGIRINAISMEDKYLELVLNEYEHATKENEELLTALVNQRANNIYNTWEVRIRPYSNDRDTTYAELYVNGKFEGAEYVSRYHKDEYSASTACIEVCKKLFGVKDEEKKDEEIPAPKYYTGKVVCIERNPWFTQGKVYEVEDGNVIDDQGSIYGFIEGVNDMCDQIKVEFIEFVE